jgi:YVTN family beta-propeller protein
MNSRIHLSRARRRGLLFAAVLALGLVGAPLHFFIAPSAAQLVSAPEESGLRQSKRFAGPTSSQPLALTANDAFLVVANPDNNSVTFFNVRNDRNRLIAEVPVQMEPNGVAFLPDGTKAYVANTVSGTVSVINTNSRRGIKAIKHIEVGTEPYGLVLTPNGKKLYVSNSRSDSVSVIDTKTDKVIKTIPKVGFEPRGLAITNDGDDDDSDETLYVTQFLSLPVAGKVDGQDDAKKAFVTVVSTNTDTVVSNVAVNPIADTGFKALGDAIARSPPGANFIFTTGAYPNQLNNIGIRGNFAYLPNTGASPNGPLRFDVNTHSLLSVINRSLNQDAGQTINMHTAVRDQVNPPKLFITLPWAIAFKHHADEGYVISAASNIVVKLAVDPATGAATVQTDPSDPADPTRVLQIKVGKNPRGIVVNSTDTRAYVMNYVSRDVSALDLTTTPESLLATLPSAILPSPGSSDEKVQIGKELYNTSVGEFDPPPGSTTPIVGRMSNNGWGACAACHTPFGLSDNVVWIFPSGPKRTIPQHTDFDLMDPNRASQRMLNWVAERDEEEDFELNIRAVSGGQGLIVLADGISQDPMVFNLRPLASGNRNQLKVRGNNAWDAIKAFIQFGIRPPISPVSKNNPMVTAGRALFTRANCQQCHGGPQWTNSKVFFTPPPDAALVDAKGQVFSQLRNVGTFDPTFLNEVNTNGAPSLGADGFVPPSLLSLFAFPQTFFHNGAARSLVEVLRNVTHRSAGTGGVDTLTHFRDRAMVVKFLQSIDAATTPIPLPDQSLEATEASGQTRATAATAPTLTVNNGSGGGQHGV